MAGRCTLSREREPSSLSRLTLTAPPHTFFHVHTTQTTIQAIDALLPPGLAAAPPPPPPARPPVCVVTGRPAPYRDPVTGAPYADAAAFKVLRARAVSGGGVGGWAAPQQEPTPPAGAPRGPPGPPRGLLPPPPAFRAPPPPPPPSSLTASVMAALGVGVAGLAVGAPTAAAAHQSPSGAQRSLPPGAGPLLPSPPPRGPRGGGRAPKAIPPRLPGVNEGGNGDYAPLPLSPPGVAPPPAKKAKRGKESVFFFRARSISHHFCAALVYGRAGFYFPTRANAEVAGRHIEMVVVLRGPNFFPALAAGRGRGSGAPFTPLHPWPPPSEIFSSTHFFCTLSLKHHTSFW